MCSLMMIFVLVMIGVTVIRGGVISDVTYIMLGLFSIGSAIEQLSSKFKKQ